jgi:hypothetical protein
MGWERRELLVIGSVSRNNTDQDREDDRLWSDLKARIIAIVEEEQYAAIAAEVE